MLSLGKRILHQHMVLNMKRRPAYVVTWLPMFITGRQRKEGAVTYICVKSQYLVSLTSHRMPEDTPKCSQSHCSSWVKRDMPAEQDCILDSYFRTVAEPNSLALALEMCCECSQQAGDELHLTWTKLQRMHFSQQSNSKKGRSGKRRLVSSFDPLLGL